MLTWPFFVLGEGIAEGYWPPRDVCVLISGNSEYTSLRGKGGYTENGIKIAARLTLSWEVPLHFPGEPHVMTGVLVSGRGKQGRQNQGDSSTRRTPPEGPDSGGGGRGHSPGGRASLEAGKGEGQVLPRSLQRSRALMTRAFPVKPGGLLTFRTAIHKGVGCQATKFW